MFHAEDLIIYGNSGVCRVLKTEERQRDGRSVLYYVLKPLYSGYTISVPVDSDKVFMRPIISREQAKKLIDMIPSVREEAYHCQVMRHLSEHYEKLIESHDCIDLIKLTTSIYAKKRYMEKEKRKFGALDERYMKRGEDLLFGELAAALNISRDEVPGYIRSRIGVSEEA